MLHLIFAELAEGILKDMIRKREKETSHNPFLQPIEAEIERLQEIEKQVKSRLEVVKQLHRWVSEVFDPPKTEKTAETRKKDEPEKTVKYQGQPEKFDTGKDEPLSEPMLERLKALEQVVKDVAEKLANADMTGRFKQLGELHQKLEKCLNFPDEKKETMEYLVELETTIGDALDFLATSKLGTRFKLLRQLRQELGEALTASREQ